jgi:hypothetical protein
MVVLTDLLTRETLTPEHFSALSLKSGAIVHLATVAASATSLARDDESPWAVLPRTTGGVFWHAGADTVDAAARDTFEEWARPKRLDSLRVRGFPEGFSVPDVLVEGQGLEYLGIAESRPAELVVEGLLWSTPARIAVTSTADEERRWSALVFGSAESDGLSEDEQRVLAMKGRAVSPVTSYLAIEPGVRPSTDGLDRVEGIGEGGGGVGEGVGMGNIGMIGHGYGGASVDPQRFLESELGRAWRACGGIGHAEMKLESTVDEVVDVARPAVAVPSGHAAECLVKAAWALDLPGTFTGLHETWTVGVEG